MKIWVTNCVVTQASLKMFDLTRDNGGKYEVGEPKATPTYTIDQLKQKNLIGIYRIEKPAEEKTP